MKITKRIVVGIENSQMPRKGIAGLGGAEKGGSESSYKCQHCEQKFQIAKVLGMHAQVMHGVRSHIRGYADVY